MQIDWHSPESHLFINPRNTSSFSPQDWEGFRELKSHIWLATSGTTQAVEARIKWVALSKEAFLSSADAVNAHLSSNQKDIWLNALPLFHVGGLSIYARAFLSGASVKTPREAKWNPASYLEELAGATWTSLVPTQLYDLVQMNKPAPPSLRGVIIGGGHCPRALYEKAISLKWPVMPSFGMTECCSQVATATLSSELLQILPHMHCTISREGYLEIRSPALLTGYLYIEGGNFRWEDPKVDGRFQTEDLADIEGNTLKFLGRKSDWIKISGENVSLFHLDAIFDTIKPSGFPAYISSCKEARLGNAIELVVLKGKENEATGLIFAFNEKVMPYERIHQIRCVEQILYTNLGKLIKT